MMWENRAYHEAVQGYGKRDAFLALLIFLILMLLLYGQGWLYTTNLPLSVMASLNILTGLCSVGMAVTLVWASAARVGQKLGRWGIAGGGLGWKSGLGTGDSI